MAVGYVLAALITGLFAFFLGKTSSKGQYITKQREDWRDYLRKWLEDFVFMLNKYHYLNSKSKNDDLNEELEYLAFILDSKISAMISRLNPYRDEGLIYYLRKSECKRNKILDKEEKIRHNLDLIDPDTVTYYISIILKEDWERVKKNTSIFGQLRLLNILYILSIFKYLLVLFNNITFSLSTNIMELGSQMNNEVQSSLKSILILTTVYFTLRIIYNVLLHFEIFRRFTTDDYFLHDSKPREKTRRNWAGGLIASLYIFFVLCFYFDWYESLLILIIISILILVVLIGFCFIKHTIKNKNKTKTIQTHCSNVNCKFPCCSIKNKEDIYIDNIKNTMDNYSYGRRESI